MASTRYDYTGGTRAITLQPGRYRLEAFGAGGGNDGNPGGKGGYARGDINLTTAKTLFLCIGGAGTTGTGAAGGYNGGGKSGLSGSSGSGGGATHIAIGNLDRGVLASYEAAKSEILLVAGGGGGAGVNGAGGNGGGFNGGANSKGKISGQSSGYSFGNGEDRVGIGGATQTKTITGTASYISRSNGASYYTTVATITITASGTLVFGSTSSTANTCNSDPYGYIYKNGALFTSNDDSGTGYNFYMSINVSIGDVITLKIAGYSTSGSTPWYCTYPSGQPVDGGAGGGGWYGGYAAESDANGGGGSGYANSSILTNTLLTSGGGANSASHGYIIITEINFGIKLIFQDCNGTHNILRTGTDTEAIVTYNGPKKIINQVLLLFEGWIFPDTQDLIFTMISATQYKVSLNIDTTTLPNDKSYTIKALYVRGRLNSNYYKNAKEFDIIDWLKLIDI